MVGLNIVCFSRHTCQLTHTSSDYDLFILMLSVAYTLDKLLKNASFIISYYKHLPNFSFTDD